MNIVIVDNEKKRINKLNDILKKLYPVCNIKEFTDSAQAVKHIMRFNVDLIFAESVMNQIDGFELRSITRRLNSQAKVIISDDTDSEFITQQDLILVRPVTAQKITELINKTGDYEI